MFFLFTVFNCGLNAQRHPLKKEVGKSLKFGRKKRRMWTRRTMFGKWDNSLLWQGNVVRYIKVSKLGKGLSPTPAPYLKATFSTRLLKSISSILGQYVSKLNVIDQLHHLGAIWQYLQTGEKPWLLEKRLVSVVLVFCDLEILWLFDPWILLHLKIPYKTLT